MRNRPLHPYTPERRRIDAVGQIEVCSRTHTPHGRRVLRSLVQVWGEHLPGFRGLG
jgi:hypothetical protein